MNSFYFRVHTHATAPAVHTDSMYWTDAPLAPGEQGKGIYIKVDAPDAEQARERLHNPKSGDAWVFVRNPLAEDLVAKHEGSSAKITDPGFIGRERHAEIH